MTKQLCHRSYSRKTPQREHANYKKSKEWQEFYGSRLWHNLRDNFIYYHPLCMECLKKGISKPAQHVHHSVPFSWFPEKDDKWKCFLYEDWLVPLCSECHKEIHKTLVKPLDFEHTREYKFIHTLE